MFVCYNLLTFLQHNGLEDCASLISRDFIQYLSWKNLKLNIIVHFFGFKNVVVFEGGRRKVVNGVSHKHFAFFLRLLWFPISKPQKAPPLLRYSNATFFYLGIGKAHHEYQKGFRLGDFSLLVILTSNKEKEEFYTFLSV